MIALDGNPVPSPKTVSMLRLAPAERVCALVDMNRSGSWILGEVRKHIQGAGMGIVIEYDGTGAGKPLWEQPQQLLWNYEQFGTTYSAATEPEPHDFVRIAKLSISQWREGALAFRTGCNFAALVPGYHQPYC